MNTRTGVHHPPESAFMIKRIRRSQSNGIDVHNQPERAIYQTLATAVHPDVRENGGQWLVDAAPGLFGFAGVHGIERADEAAEEMAGDTLLDLRHGGMRYFIRETPNFDGVAALEEVVTGPTCGPSDDDALGAGPSPG